MSLPCPWKCEVLALLRLERKYAQEMIAHAQAEAPNECCGVLAGAEGKVVALYRAINAARSPVRYSVEPKELLRIYREIEDRGWDLLALYHSHTHSLAYPSVTDRELAFWPDSLYVIISLQNPQKPLIRAFHIREGQVDEEELEVV